MNLFKDRDTNTENRITAIIFQIIFEKIKSKKQEKQDSAGLMVFSATVIMRHF